MGHLMSEVYYVGFCSNIHLSQSNSEICRKPKNAQNIRRLQPLKKNRK